MYRTNLRDVPKVEGLNATTLGRHAGAFLIDKKTADATRRRWTVLKPGARHENHRHHHCDEFFIVLKATA